MNAQKIDFKGAHTYMINGYCGKEGKYFQFSKILVELKIAKKSGELLDGWAKHEKC